jgi:hypothetical protein
LLAQDNPFVGRWTLNLAKSKFSGMQAPKNETRTVLAQGSGETVAYEGIASNGSQFGYSFMTNRDGDSPYFGTQLFGAADTVAVKRVDANTITSISKKAGKTLHTTRTVVSKDGKVTTQTTGQPISITIVWDKQ